jgi:hypothetical protein
MRLLYYHLVNMPFAFMPFSLPVLLLLGSKEIRIQDTRSSYSMGPGSVETLFICSPGLQNIPSDLIPFQIPCSSVLYSNVTSEAGQFPIFLKYFIHILSWIAPNATVRSTPRFRIYFSLKMNVVKAACNANSGSGVRSGIALSTTM